MWCLLTESNGEKKCWLTASDYIGSFGDVPLWMWLYIIEIVIDRVVGLGLYRIQCYLFVFFFNNLKPNWKLTLSVWLLLPILLNWKGEMCNKKQDLSVAVSLCWHWSGMRLEGRGMNLGGSVNYFFPYTLWELLVNFSQTSSSQDFCLRIYFQRSK